MTPAEKRQTWRRITLARRRLALQQVFRAGRGRPGAAVRARRQTLMLRLTQAPNIAIAALWVDALRHAGIQASMQRYFLGAAAGELPPDQCLPEVWLIHDEQEAEARGVLRDLMHLPQRRWLCRVRRNGGGRLRAVLELRPADAVPDGQPGAAGPPCLTSSAAARCRRCSSRRRASARLPGPSPAAACCAAPARPAPARLAVGHATDTAGCAGA